MERRKIEQTKVLSDAAKAKIEADLASGKYSSRTNEREPARMPPSQNPGDYSLVRTGQPLCLSMHSPQGSGVHDAMTSRRSLYSVQSAGLVFVRRQKYPQHHAQSGMKEYTETTLCICAPTASNPVM